MFDRIIVPLPCGCWTDPAKVDIVGNFITCPWCSSTFDALDVQMWMDLDAPLMFGKVSRPLIAFGDEVYERIGACGGCGNPYARRLFTADVVELPKDMVVELRD